MNEAMRAAFEAWWESRQRTTFPSDYDESRLKHWGILFKGPAWDAWQAATLAERERGHHRLRKENQEGRDAMKTDRELLELAANAAGHEVVFWSDKCAFKEAPFELWNPLTDDGDALRLMARLNINVYYRENINGAFVIADHEGINFCPESLDGPHEDVATRRAIFRAAAAIGEKHDQTQT